MNLFINTYTDKNPERDKELKECLYQNVINEQIDKIYLFCKPEDFPMELYKEELDRIIPVHKYIRPTFKDYFNVINAVTRPNDINVITNSDIYIPMDDGLMGSPTNDQCFALSRWDIQPDGSAVHYNNSGSQDTWIFRGAIRMVEGANFTQGVPGCDNKIAYLLTEAGYVVTNPSTTIKTYHLHLSGIRHHEVDARGRVIPNRKLYRLPHPRINVQIT